MRCIAVFAVVNLSEQRRLTEVASGFAQKEQNVTVTCGAEDRIIEVLDQANSTDGRGRQDALTIGFVVERYVARHDRGVERDAGLTDALKSANELTHDLWLLRVAKVQVVGGCQRLCPYGREVTVGFGNGLFAAFNRVCLHVARGHVRGEGNSLVGAVDAHDASAQARFANGVAHNLAVVLFVDPLFASVVWGRNQRLQAVNCVNGRNVCHRCCRWGRNPRTVVFGCRGRQFRERQVRLDFVAVEDDETVFGDGFTDDCEIEVPFFEHSAGFGLELWVQNHEHTLLGFREHHLVGGHVGFTLGNAVQFQLNAQVTFVAHFNGGTG